jgi:hypothetical protein
MAMALSSSAVAIAVCSSMSKARADRNQHERGPYPGHGKHHGQYEGDRGGEDEAQPQQPVSPAALLAWIGGQGTLP